MKTQSSVESHHSLYLADARELGFIADESVHLVLTSPPYWSLKRYEENDSQLGHLEDYENFLVELNKVWEHVYRVLVPGGRLVCVVGDVCLSRKENKGRHVVVPLHADICVACRRIGFDNLNPIIWHKISNASYEVERGSKFLGKPYEPNAIIKNDIEFILMQRKPGGYRKPTLDQREASRISKQEFDKWFQQFWTLSGASTKEHPAPYPEELAYRLIRMFSFVGDTILDPFCGTGTSIVAAARAGRHGIGIEIEPKYLRMAAKRFWQQTQTLFSGPSLDIHGLEVPAATTSTVSEATAPYVASRTTRRPTAVKKEPSLAVSRKVKSGKKPTVRKLTP